MKKSIFSLAIILCLFSVTAFAQKQADSTKSRKNTHCFTIPDLNFDDFNFDMPRMPEFPELAQIDIWQSFGEISSEFGENTEEKTKTVNNTFSVNDNTGIFVKNKYGNVNVETWSNKTVDVRVEIKARASTPEKAAALLDKIRIDMKENKNENAIEIKTNLEDLGKTFNASFEIDYYLKVPKGNFLTIKNSFGNVILPDFDGKLDLEVSYGKITTGSLNNKFSNILLSFGGGTIEALPVGNVSARYSNLTITSAKNIDLKSEFSNVKVGSADNVELYSRYGDIKFEKLGFVKGTSQFSGMSINTLTQGAELSVKYCPNLRIRNLQEGFKTLNVNLMYSNLDIESTPKSAFDFNVALRFGSMTAKGSSKLNEMNENYKNTYTGSYGTGSASSMIYVTGEYSKVKLNPASN